MIKMAASQNLRSSSTVNWEETFKPLDAFPRQKLPTSKEVIGYILTRVSSHNSYENAITECKKVLFDHWVHRNVYPVNVRTIKYRLDSLIKEYKNLVGTPLQRKGTDDYIKRANAFCLKGDKHFDIFCESKDQRDKYVKEYGVPMLKEDFDFLESMLTDRKACCSTGIDKSWHTEKERSIEKEKKKIQRENMPSSTTTLTHTEINDALEDDETMTSSSSEESLVEEESPYKPQQSTPTSNTPQDMGVNKKRRKIFSPPSTNDEAVIETRLRSSEIDYENVGVETGGTESFDASRHMWISEQKVCNEIYETYAELDGHNFSYKESAIAITVVARRLFGCNWNIPTERNRLKRNGDENTDDDEQNIFDIDTLPTRKAVREMLQKIEAQSLKLTANKLIESKGNDTVVTHATVSTTWKRVVSFAPQGLHINRDEFLPLPTLQISSRPQKTLQLSNLTSGC